MSFFNRKPPKLSKEDTERFIKRAIENENKLKQKLIEIAEQNTKCNEDGFTVIEKDDPWRDE